MTTLTVQRVTGTSFLSWLGKDVPLQRVASTHGGEYAGPCPFCGGEDRFRVWPDQGRYWCRRCDAQGDAIDYLRQKHGLSFRDAVRALGGQGPTVPAAQRGGGKPSSPSWSAAGEALAAECHAALWKDARALAYLHGRGLHDATIAEFALGYNAQSGYRYGLNLPAGWTIPLYGVDRRFYGLQVRQPDGVEPKYKLVAGGRHPLMGRLTGKAALLVTEGGFDMMLAWQEVGNLVDVATLGSCSADPLPWLASLLSFRRILLCYDLDEAGEKGRGKWGGIGGVVQVRLPLDRSKGKDITDFVRAGGALGPWVVSLLPGGHDIAGQAHAIARPNPLAPSATMVGPDEEEDRRILEGIQALGGLGGLVNYRALSLRLRQHHEETYRLCERLVEQGRLCRRYPMGFYSLPDSIEDTQDTPSESDPAPPAPVVSDEKKQEEDYQRILEGIQALGGLANYRALSLRLRQHHEETHRLCEQLVKQGRLCRHYSVGFYSLPEDQEEESDP